MMEISDRRRRSSLATLRIIVSSGLFTFVLLCLAMLLAGGAQQVGADAGIQTDRAVGGSGCWSKVASPDHGGYSALKDVEAVSDNSVWAVGSYRVDYEGFALILKWDGTNWNEVPTPPAFNGELNGLAVVSASDMWAVGTQDGFGLIFHWDGTQWIRVSQAPVPGYTVLSGVYAVASNDVWAVGYFEDNTTFVDHMLVEHWDGVQWTLVATPIIDPNGDMLNSVGGTSSGEIWVAGRTDFPRMLTMRWNGSGWDIPTMPSSTLSWLNGIEVLSANDVWAVGRLNFDAAALHWDGTVWSIAYTYPTPANDLSEFYGIRALAANDIWAMGYTFHDGFTSTLTMHWDGTQWNIVPSPSFGPSGSKLYAAAPVNVNDVWAVGTNVFDNISGTILVERYANPCQAPTQTTTPAPTVTIDPSFGDGGKVVTDFDSGSDIGYDTVVQPDGKIVVVGAATQSFDGRMGLARYNQDGSLDTSFGGDGKVADDVTGQARSVALQADGKIVIAGFTGASSDFVVARYNPDGTIDTSFGGNGYTVTDFFGLTDEAYNMRIQPDGKIVLVGYAYFNDNGTVKSYFAVARYNTDGSLDTTFGGDGKVTTAFTEPSPSDVAFDIAVQADGKLVASGWAYNIAAMVRYNANGDPDPSFDGDGRLTLNFMGFLRAVDIQPDGKIVAAGNSGSRFAVIRLNPDGTRDTSFGGGGIGSVDIPGSGEDVQAMVMQSDGKFVVAGSCACPNSSDFALGRISADGIADPSFGQAGAITTDFLGEGDTANGVAVQPDGKIVAAGYAAHGFDMDFAVARYGTGPFSTSTPVASITATVAGSATATLTTTRTATSTTTVTATVSATGTQGTSTPIPTGTTNITQTPGGPSATPDPTDTTTTVPTNTTVPTSTASSTPTTCSIAFTDVPPGSTFYPYIQCMACQGIINGYPCGGPGEPCDPNHDPYFRPGNNVTRGQFAKITANAAGFTETPGAQQYEDVLPGSTFYDFIWRLSNRGYITGYPCGGVGEPCGPNNLPYFRPNANVTRGQIAKIDANAAGYSDTPGAQQYEDVLPGSTFYDFIWRLSDRGLVNGYPCGGAGEPCGPSNLPYFRPSANATRGQASKIVSNTFFPSCNVELK